MIQELKEELVTTVFYVGGFESFIPCQNTQFYLRHCKCYTQLVGILIREAWLLPNSFKNVTSQLSQNHFYYKFTENC